MPDITPSAQVTAQANAIAANAAIGWESRVSQIRELYRQNGLSITDEQANDIVANAHFDAGLDSQGQVANPSDENEEIVVTGTRNNTAVQERADHRVRISAFRGQEAQVYGPADRSANILEPLYATGGLMFPYTPTVAVSQDTTWQQADLEGVNYDILSFKSASSATLSVTGKFTVQNQREGRYLLAAIHFLRTVSKAYFGAQDVEAFDAVTLDNASASIDPTVNSEMGIQTIASGGRAGLPPPVLLFSGYGNMMFNDIRVVVKSHSWSFDEAADLVRINLPAHGGTVWLPPLMTINMTLAIQQNTDTLRNEFSLDKFRTGELLKKRGWF